ncbi:MAG: glycosyltransferase [Alistipes sp.]|nr:glycosyltransferase [Alistipes sp.]
MPKLLQISIEVNSGSVGRIAEQIGETAIANGWQSYITYARNHLPSKSTTIRIGRTVDVYWHGVMTRLFDTHCLHSTVATRRLVEQIKEIAPDVILLHHIHGYFLNMKVLFEYLSSINTPIVWVFHDCWAMTGHCTHFEMAKCDRWKSGCHDCPQKGEYPSSILFDRSRKNYNEKRSLFTSVKNMTIVPVSNWLGDIVGESFLGKYNVEVIHNGIDVSTFKPLQSDIKNKYGISGKKVILGVASPWCRRKGLEDILKLYTHLPKEQFQIVMIGLSERQQQQLPEGIIGFRRTENVEELAKWYSAADVFINPTYEDTYPTTNLEAISCGTPVVTYNTGGSPESLTVDTGIVVAKGDIESIVKAIEELCDRDREVLRKNCREYAVANFDKKMCFDKYMKLYDKLIKR